MPKKPELSVALIQNQGPYPYLLKSPVTAPKTCVLFCTWALCIAPWVFPRIHCVPVTLGVENFRLFAFQLVVHGTRERY